jgi:dephospho-CoA kinase
LRASLRRRRELVLVLITGNIGSGKSTLSRIIRLKGYPVLNGDEVGKELLKKGSKAYPLVVKAFGEEILAPDGEIDTKKLGKVVFRDKKKLELLTSITHPLIVEEVRQWGELHKGQLAFVEAAVAIESGWVELFDRVVLVFAYKGQRLLRAARKFGLREALRRDSLQLPYREKLKYADFLICNTKGLLFLKEQAEYLLKELEEL